MHVIGTAGHVDHGKSALVERLTGIDPDRFAEEKRRGLTIDLGFAWLPLPSGREIGLIDVPGHERFIKNMLAGAGGISICLFVVAANEGWMPQSAEHLAVLDVLGIKDGVVALTKSDTVDAEMLEIASAEIEEQLARSSLAGSPIVACSALTGAGLDVLVEAIDKVVGSAPAVVDAGRPRLWVDRVFTIAGAGTVVTGTLMEGSLEAGQEVEISPEGRRARIRTIQSHKKEVHVIEPGNRVALNLVGLSRQGAERGDAVVRAGQWRPTRLIDAQVRVLPQWATGSDHELSEKGSHLLYVGSAETPVGVKLFGTTTIESGETGFAQLHLRNALPLVRGDRFVLRDAGRVLTFGGGVVLDPLPREARRSDATHLRLLEQLSIADPSGALRAMVGTHGKVEARGALLRSGAREVPRDVATLGPLLVSHDHLEELRTQVRDALEEHHRKRPLERGMPREALRATAGLAAEAFDPLVAAMPEVAEEGALVRLSAHSVVMSDEQQRSRRVLIERIESAGFTPPPAKALGAHPELLRALTEAGDLVKVGDFYLTADLARRARALVRARIEESGPLSVAHIRDLLGTSRKYAVPLCEWLDQTGATMRRGDNRVLGPNP
jgi:selenocysteine-specific elongation factor